MATVTRAFPLTRLLFSVRLTMQLNKIHAMKIVDRVAAELAETVDQSSLQSDAVYDRLGTDPEQRPISGRAYSFRRALA